MIAPEIELDDYQQSVFDRVLCLVDAGQHHVVALRGEGGTGKSQIIKKLLTHFGDNAIAACPTNDAKNILIDGLGDDCPAMVVTCHKLLNKRAQTVNGVEQLDSSGNIIFSESIPIKDSVQLIIVDESSMLSEQMALDLINKAKHCVLLFAGDHDQLKPVNAEAFFQDLKAETYTLTFNHRAKGSPDLTVFLKRVRAIKDDEIVDFEAVESTVDAISEAVIKYGSEIMVMAHTHAICSQVNNAVRAKKGFSGLFAAGDEIIIDSALKTVDGLSLDAGTKIKIQSASKEHGRINGVSFDVWNITPVSVSSGGDFMIIDQRSLDEMEIKSVGNAIKQARDAYFKGNKRSPIALEFPSIVPPNTNRMPVVYAYCRTVHRAQGAGANIAMFVCNEASFYKPDDYNLFYTAISRARKRAIVVQLGEKHGKKITGQLLKV
jgi:hypothetical protein